MLRDVFAGVPIESVPRLTLPDQRPPDPPRCFVGVDLAQVSDYTAISIVEQHGERGKAEYQVRHLERIERGTSYPLIVQRVALLARHPSVMDRSMLAVDQTGVGRAVVDLLRAEQLHLPLVPITITAGELAHIAEDGSWTTPKRDLVAVLQVLLQTGRLKVAPALPAAELLMGEMEAFQVKLSAAGRDTYGAWREGSHDDLVLSVALAAWCAERGIGGPTEFY